MNLPRAVLALTTSAGFLMSGATAFGAGDPGFDKPYDAVMTITDPQGTTIESRTTCDGKGKLRSESKSALGTNVTIMDHKAKKVSTIIEPSKMVIVTPLMEGSGVAGAAPPKKANLKDLGIKTINGHPCKGEAFEEGKTKKEYWTGTDINYLVKSTSSTNGQKVVTELKSYSTKTPDPKLFEIPAGYKTMTR